MISPFLLREVLDVAIPERDTALLTWLVGGMIAISIATGALGVGQTWLSNVVGQRVMHDLRTAVYRHLQRLSLAFFTRTRTGEVQSRIANDIGGVQNVVTSTATSIVSNVTTVLATIVGDGRCSTGGWPSSRCALLPFFVWLTAARRPRAQAHHRPAPGPPGRHVRARRGVAVGQRHPAGQDDGPLGRARRALRGASPRELADLEVRSRMAGRWRMASVQMSFAAMPALVYWFAGQSLASGGAAITIGTLVAFTTLQTRLFFPIQSLLRRGHRRSRPRSRCSHRIFEYLDLPVDVAERDGARTLDPRPCAARSRFEDVRFGYDAGRARDARRHRPRRPGRARKVAVVGETGRGQDHARLPGRAPLRRRRGPRDDRRRRRARPDLRLAGRDRRRRLPGHLPVPRLDRRQPALRPARGHRRGAARRRRARRRSTTSSRRCPTATTPSSASAGTASPAASSSASPSPAPSCATRRCSCSTRPRARWTPRPSAPCRRRWTAWRDRPHDHRHRPPPVDRARRRPHRRARAAAASPSAAPTTSCSPAAAATPRSSRRAARRRRGSPPAA